MTRAFGLTIRKMFIDNKRIFIRFIVVCHAKRKKWETTG